MPKKVCCGQIEIKPMDTEIIIFRHPDERRNTLSTVSLIKQRHPEILVKEGVNFRPIRRASCALLFPKTPTNSPAALNDPPYQAPQESDAETTLLLIDATWKKAKRMLYENPWLAELPRVALKPPTRSDYLLRKGPGGTALSTVEAFAMVQNDAALRRTFAASWPTRYYLGKTLTRKTTALTTTTLCPMLIRRELHDVHLAFSPKSTNLEPFAVRHSRPDEHSRLSRSYRTSSHLYN